MGAQVPCHLDVKVAFHEKKKRDKESVALTRCPEFIQGLHFRCP